LRLDVGESAGFTAFREEVIAALVSEWEAIDAKSYRQTHRAKEQDHDEFPEDGLPGLHRTSSSARSWQPVRPRLCGQRASLRTAAWISGQLAHL
jgi:hypothetical protein